VIGTLAGAVGVFLLAATPHAVASPWRTVQPGVDYARFDLPNPLHVGESRLHVVRIDPRVARFAPGLASEHGGQSRTAADWCREQGLAVAINMGMFRSDGLTNVGYLRSGSRANNGRWNAYRSVLCVGPRQASRPKALWIDRDSDTAIPPRAGEYGIVVQNLRLIRNPGRSVWPPTAKRWSEAAVGMDAGGRLLFLFARCPLSMAEFNRAVLGLPLGVMQAMHVEGGPEASLSLHAGGFDLDLCGSYETGFHEGDSNHLQWPIPNVLGVKRLP
jgi:hypothetical protein